MHEILVGGEQGKIVLDAQLRNQRIDGTELHALVSAGVAQRRGLNVGVVRGTQERQRLQALDEVG